MPIKGENIYKRKDGRWEARYIREYRADGAPRYGYCYGKTYREAKQKQTQARSRNGTPPAVPKEEAEAMGVLLGEWLALRRMQVKEATFMKYQRMIRCHILPYWGDCPVSRISSRKVEDFARELLTGKSLAPKTARDILTLLHSIIRYAADRFPGAVPAVAAAHPRSDRQEPRVLSREEQRRLVAYLTADRDPCRFGVLLTLMTGMRVGELCALRWSDISEENGTVRVSASLQRIAAPDPIKGTRSRVIFTSPKSERSRRLIPLSARALALCEENRCQDPDAYVLTGNRDAFMEPRTLQYRFARYARECGLDGVHLHTLRHTFATRCVEVDFEIKALSEILGHSSPKITLERYVHASLGHKRENMRKLDGAGL